MRFIVPAAPLLLLLAVAGARPAHADILDLALTAGGGGASVVSDPCGYDGSCSDPRLRHSGPAALVGVAFHRPWPGGALPPHFDTRWGGRIEAAALATGSGFATTVVEIELGLVGLSLNGGIGLTLLWMNDDDRRDRGVTPAFVFGAALPINRSLAVAGRAELHGFMHSVHAAAFAGVALEWRPGD